MSDHPWMRSLRDRGACDRRDLADAIHLLCQLHGVQPTIVDEALHRCRDDEARRWLLRMATGFGAQRAVLVRLTAAIGPLPSTPGAAQTSAALAGQRHAIATLGTSERYGCALGAVAALGHDWVAIHAVMARAAAETAVNAPPPDWDVETAATLIAGVPGAERAFRFGAQQMHHQHEALAGLLAARAAARRG